MSKIQHSMSSIYKFLDATTSGQIEAKKALSYAGFMYSTRQTIKTGFNPYLKFKRSNIMLIGPTGCGKTHLSKALGECLNIPFVEIDAPECTPHGMSGPDMEEIIVKEVQSMRKNGKYSSTCGAIIFVDEIDKICGRLATTKHDDFNIEKQNAILKLVEGKDLANGDNSGDYLFVFAGSFMHHDRAQKIKSIGFTNQLEMLSPESQEDLHKQVIKSGLKPELSGRISIIAELDNLNKKDLLKVLTEVEGNLYSQYRKVFKYTNKSILSLTEEEIDTILEKCIATGTGARGLQTQLDLLLFHKFNDLEFEIPEVEILKYIKDENKINELRLKSKKDEASNDSEGGVC